MGSGRLGMYTRRVLRQKKGKGERERERESGGCSEESRGIDIGSDRRLVSQEWREERREKSVVQG